MQGTEGTTQARLVPALAELRVWTSVGPQTYNAGTSAVLSFLVDTFKKVINR